MYDQETNTETTNRSERKVDSVGDFNGERNPVHLCFGYGNQLYAWTVGKGSRQWRDIQNDFTRLQHLNRRHDWLPVWYQANAE